jgi:cytochrome c553
LDKKDICTDKRYEMKFIKLTIVALLIFSCNNKKQAQYVTVENKQIANQTEHPGKKLLETYCYICHNPTMPEDQGRIAPPMVAIKYHYINDDTTKEEFIKQIVDYTANPTEEKAKLFGAVRRFGVMPKQQFPEGVIEKIADYMFDNDIEEPDWFQDHMKGKGPGNRNGKRQGFGNGKRKGHQNDKNFGNTNNSKSAEDIGLEYALSTKKILGQNLMGTIQKEGTLAALNFCNIQAIPLTDSMATKHNANIKRVSDKPRNPDNKANSEELTYINQYKKQVSLNLEVKPTIIEKGEKVQFYYPITTNSMCLQCHGDSNNIDPEVRRNILSLYPNDMAYDYTENQVRGIWSIEFDKP